MLKKVFLILLFLLLVIFSILAFDYNKFLNNDGVKTTSHSLLELKSLVKENFNTFKAKFIKKDQEKQIAQKPVIIELIKDNNNIIMNGTFKDEIQAKNISDILHINRDGQYAYDYAINSDEEFLNKLSKVATSFKEFFQNKSKLLVNGKNITLEGELKDTNSNKLLKTIIDESGLNIKTNLVQKPIVKTKDEQKETQNKDAKELKQNTKPEKEETATSKKQKLQLEINNILKENKISFQRASVKLKGKSYLSVKKIMRILRANPDIKVEIGGHTDSKGRASLNKRISQKRANRVMKAFVDFKIDPSRLTAVGYGEEFPLVKENKLGLAEQNRRVEIKILGE